MEKSNDEKREDSLASPGLTSETAWSSEDVDVEAGTGVKISTSFFQRRLIWLRSLNIWRNLDGDEDADVFRTITRKLDGCPEGYCQIATFQSSDPNFLQYRGFGYLHCRLLSALQYDLERLEAELDKLDVWEKSKGDPETRLTCKENDDLYKKKDQYPKAFQARFKRTRYEVLADLRTKLIQYDEVLLKTREMASLQRPSRKDYKSVRSWFENHKPVVEGEREYLRHKEDIITLRSGRECAGFDGFIENLLLYVDTCLAKIDCYIIRNSFMTKELREKTSDPELLYYAPARVDTLVGIVISVIIFILLVLPVVAMYKLSNLGESASPLEAVGILIIFTLLFSMAMSILTKAKRHELFAASAAYCAVLVVFIGNFSTQTVTIVP